VGDNVASAGATGFEVCARRVPSAWMYWIAHSAMIDQRDSIELKYGLPCVGMFHKSCLVGDTRRRYSGKLTAIG
jgi:hypothetical protein